MKPRADRVVSLAAIALISAQAESSAADWPQWLGPNRDGVTSERIAAWPPVTLWKASVGLGYTSPVVADGRVYFVGHQRGAGGRGTDTVYCLDAETGEARWKHSFDSLTERRDKTAGYPGPRATPALDDGAVYTLSLDGRLFCLDAATGEVRWSKDLPRDMGAKVPFYGYCGSPLVCGDRLIVEANIPGGGSYVAFDKRTGDVVWKSGSESASTASPAVAHVNGHAVALFVSDSVLAGHAVDSGEQLWRIKLGWTTWMGPVVSGEFIFCSSASLARGCAVFRFGEERPVWRAKREYQALHCNTVLWNGHLYGSDNTRTDYQYEDNNRSRLRCIDFATGEVKWTLKGMGWANVIVAGGRLLILRACGELVLMEVSPEGHREIGRANVIDGPCWTVPALAGGRIYCRNNRGEVVCLDVAAEAD